MPGVSTIAPLFINGLKNFYARMFKLSFKVQCQMSLVINAIYIKDKAIRHSAPLFQPMDVAATVIHAHYSFWGRRDGQVPMFSRRSQKRERVFRRRSSPTGLCNSKLGHFACQTPPESVHRLLFQP
jgi:hypothetical protein